MTETEGLKLDYAYLKARYQDEGVSVILAEASAFRSRKLKLDLDDEKSETVYVPLDQGNLTQAVLGFDPYIDRFETISASSDGSTAPFIMIRPGGSDPIPVPGLLIGSGPLDSRGMPTSLIHVRIDHRAWLRLKIDNADDTSAALADLRTRLEPRRT